MDLDADLAELAEVIELDGDGNGDFNGKGGAGDDGDMTSEESSAAANACWLSSWKIAATAGGRPQLSMPPISC